MNECKATDELKYLRNSQSMKFLTCLYLKRSIIRCHGLVPFKFANVNNFVRYSSFKFVLWTFMCPRQKKNIKATVCLRPKTLCFGFQCYYSVQPLLRF